MRRIIVITASIVGAIVILVGAILFYAAMNLDSIIAERRQTFLDKVSASLGRPVHAADIKIISASRQQAGGRNGTAFMRYPQQIAISGLVREAIIERVGSSKIRTQDHAAMLNHAARP